MQNRTALVTSLLIGICIAAPPAHADDGHGPGSYPVPDLMPRGIYTAHAEPRDSNPSDCSFSTWTSGDTIIYGDSAPPGRTLVADLSASTVAKFITHGCSPWIRAQ